MDRLTKFREGIKTGDLVTVLSSQKYFALRRNGSEWFVNANPKSYQIKKGEALIVVVDNPVSVRVEGRQVIDEDEDDALTSHEVVVFASVSACFFGLPRASLCRY